MHWMHCPLRLPGIENKARPSWPMSPLGRSNAARNRVLQPRTHIASLHSGMCRHVAEPPKL